MEHNDAEFKYHTRLLEHGENLIHERRLKLEHEQRLIHERRLTDALNGMKACENAIAALNHEKMLLVTAYYAALRLAKYPTEEAQREAQHTFEIEQIIIRDSLIQHRADKRAFFEQVLDLRRW
jgi:hypothetical protein